MLDEEDNTPAEVPDGLRRDLEKVTKDFKALDAELSQLRDKEQQFEKGQEGFYQIFKAAVAEVQSAKNKIGEWENRNREIVLEKERLDLRREEILRQIEQAGRRAEEFASISGSCGLAHSRSSGSWSGACSACAAIWRRSARLTRRS